ncbi:MAG TPA: zinc ribbon domain-containing protein [Pyrinomonadaceae bacterium]|nr:zinc ribbon domain-containing protein [Pyrinomonadaceae bacterium]
MANTTVTETACDLCGAEIRDGSLFCYNCGTAVPEERAEAKTSAPVVSAEPVVKERPPLKSAASLRQQRRASNRQPVEISWEPRTNPPILFIVASIVLALGALVLLLIALYLR